MHIPALIVDLALMLIVAGITTLLCKKLRQPLVLGYLIAGFIVGPYFNLFQSVTDTISISTWGEIGIIILMFALGLEFNLHKLASVGGTAIITAITEVTFMLAVGFGCGQLMGWSNMNSVFLGGMLAMSSTTIIIKAFDDLQLKGKKFTELVFGTLVIEDIAGIFMMIILSTIAVSQGISGGVLAGSLSKMVLYLAIWLIMGIYLIPTILKKTKNLMSDETLLIISLAMCFGMVLLADSLGFSSALGAFLAGSLLAGTVHAEQIEHLIKPIKDLFGAVFFLSVGMMVDPALIVQYAVPILTLTLVTIFVKAFFSTTGVLLSGQTLKTAVYCGCSLAQIGEFSFIIASLGISLGVMGDFIYPIIVSVSVITTFTTPYCIKASDNVYGFLDQRLPAKLSAYLNRYTSEVQSETEKSQEWPAFIKAYFTSITFYSVIIAGIILAGTSILWPFLAAYLNQNLSGGVAILAMVITIAPFMRQALVKKNEHFIPLWFGGRSNRLPLLALTVVRYAVMIFLTILPARIIFSFSIWYIILAAVVVVILIVRSDWLIGPYLKMEAQFLSNFNERNLEEQKRNDPGHNWLDEQYYVSRIRCSQEKPFLNKQVSDFVSMFQVNIKIIKIIRGNKHINIPKASEKLLLGDIIYITGTFSQLNGLQAVVNWQGSAFELEKEDEGGYLTLRDFINTQKDCHENNQLLCYVITVDKGSPLIGASIKDSQIKSEWGGLLLGLERDLYPLLDPDIHLRLEENDLIWILGPQKMTGKLAKTNLL
ncbi:MAG: cation:proton antiporter [Firmicutes bacterium]|nr:cation:proton antiporter [Bacillota bacterium]